MLRQRLSSRKPLISEAFEIWHGSCLVECMKPYSGTCRDKGANKMSKMSKVGQSVLATFAAILLTATAVGAAVAPAEALQAAPVSLV
jgi:hypothetical protein